jgi:E3 ubiquitin-protein ligase NRDP1
LGQLRHASNSNGVKYGKAFKNTGVLGILLNMIKGTLSFSLDNEYMGVAFTHESLTIPPIYPAISLLHKAGFTLVTNKVAPACFPK